MRPIRTSAVLVPIIALRELTVLFTQRTSHPRDHSGQVCFPGGQIDDVDASPAAAALREAEEEIALERRFVQPLGYLDVHIVPSGFRIVPTLALVREGFSVHISVLPPIDWTHGSGADNGLGRAPGVNENASVLGPVKHAPLTRRPAALPDLPCARWPGVARSGRRDRSHSDRTAGSLMLPSANSLPQSVAPDSRAGCGSRAGQAARMRCSVRRNSLTAALTSAAASSSTSCAPNS